MKQLVTFLFIVLSASVVFSQNECKPYLPVDVGTQWEITNYNPKGKISGKISYELIDKATTGNVTVFTVVSKTFDKKGEEMMENKFTAKCEDGRFDFDMAVKMDGTAMGPFQNMDVEVDASRYEIPDMDTPAGTELEDGTLTVSTTGGAIGVNMTINITNRKVTARETISTSAGEFDTIQLTQDVSTKMLVNVRGSTKEWYTPNLGVVRSESYNKKGKLIGYSEVSSITRL